MADDVDLRAFFKGIGKTKGAIEAYERKIQRDALKACKKLALEAQKEATSRFNDYEGPDGNNVSVRDPAPIRVDGERVGYMVEAVGKPVATEDGQVVGNSVVFEEFGSGLLAGSHPKSTWFPGIYPGSWSETYGSGAYANNGYWWYKNQSYVYVAPTYAMYLAGQRVRELQGKEMVEAFK